MLNLPQRQTINMDHFKELKWFNVRYRVQFLALNNLHKVIYAEKKNYLSEILCIKKIHQYETRQNVVPVQVPNVQGPGSGTFAYNASKYWEKLPGNIKTIKSKNSFKFKCKKLLKKEMNDELTSSYIRY